MQHLGTLFFKDFIKKEVSCATRWRCCASL